MGLLDGLMGHASKISTDEVATEFAPALAADERVEHAYRLIRDLFVFTDRRLILIDKQGMTGSKVELMSIPYRSIVRFSVEAAGHLDLDAELSLWLAGTPEPLKRTFSRNLSIYEVQAVLASYLGR
ncbi:PH domain-containing protein [Cognatilysobacter bugurensis]|uniref:Bacterial Pleckstrin homology domain-containing protein n=1 Tax=Cognatilysobacter bugurensis TaxID=543356 RepID=A0A918W8B6_9GAMM|nr:PH domain-containing protein [Lysobacter bugurensis]GHA80442.1 hypothetical protein GCM10007067_17780 [Lysobacter bugurensis]